MIYNIIEYSGMNEIVFDMKKEDIDSRVKNKYFFVKSSTENTGESIETYKEFFIYYDKNNKIEAIEFHNFAEAEVIFQGINLFSLTYEEIKSYVEKSDLMIKTDGAGFVSFKLGIGIYAPSAEKEPDELVEGIIIFKKGYYD